MLPAYAGMIRNRRRWGGRSPGAPRVCGDDPKPHYSDYACTVVLPAYAGMIPSSRTPGCRSGCAPRVCGDDPDSTSRTPGGTECSPRMRG